MTAIHGYEDQSKARRYSVAIVGPSQRFLSGISYFTLRLSNSLADHVDVQVILFRNMLPKTLFPGSKRVGVPLMESKYREDITIRESLDWYNPFTWMEAAIRTQRNDITIFQWWTSSVAHMYLAISLLNIRKRPVVIEFHEVIDPLEGMSVLLRAYSKIMGGLIRDRAACYVVHSESDRNLISQHYRIGLDKIRVIPHGIYDQYPKIDKNDAKNQLKIREKNVILFFGLLRPYKGVKYLVEAFEQLPPEYIADSRLLVVGEAWEDQESREIIANYPVKSNITLVDQYIPDKDVSLYFSAADMLVLPYTRASQSGVAHIGMSFGIPIIASRVGGLEESLGKYEGTSFVEPMQPMLLAGAITGALDSRKTFPVPPELRWEVVAGYWRDLTGYLVQGKNDTHI